MAPVPLDGDLLPFSLPPLSTCMIILIIPKINSLIEFITDVPIIGVFSV